MSDQEMQFADPDWKPTQSLQGQNGGQQPSTYTPLPINDDRREGLRQPAVEAPSEHEEVYAGLPPYAGATSQQPGQAPYQYQRFSGRGRRRGAWLWIIIAILLISLLSGGWGSLGSLGQKSAVQAKSFGAITGVPTIVIHETEGNIHVQPGASLSIETVKHVGLFDDPNNIKVDYAVAGNTITVNIDPGTGFLSSRSVDVNVTIPQVSANLDIQSSSGDISVDNTSGQMKLATSSGTVSTTGDTFNSNSSINATSGDINSRGDTFSDNDGLTTASGDISMDRDTLNGSTSINTTSGDIDFNGSIASNGAYTFQTTNGDVSIGLPSDAEFQVQANTTSGSFDDGGFSGISVQDNNSGGNQASGTVGASSGVSLTIRTINGDITLHQH